MNNTRLTVVLSGLAIIVVAAVVGYGLGTLVEKRAAPLSSQETAAPLPTSSMPSPTPTASSTATPSFVPAAAPTGPDTPRAESELRIVLEPFPTVVQAGTSFRVRWQIHGPAGITETSTRLVVIPEDGTPVVGSASSSFSLPARFEATVSIPERGNVTVVAEALANGQALRTEQQVTVR